jgi:hypothetical protein
LISVDDFGEESKMNELNLVVISVMGKALWPVLDPRRSKEGLTGP